MITPAIRPIHTSAQQRCQKTAMMPRSYQWSMYQEGNSPWFKPPMKTITDPTRPALTSPTRACSA